MSLEFLLTSLLVIVVPGTGVLYTLAIGLNHGFRTSVSAVFGCTLGIIPAATTVILGLSAIFNTSALAFQVIRVFGVMYLFYMAWSVWKDSGTRDLEKTPALENHLHIAVTGTLINVLNPKILLFSGFFATISATNHRKYYPLSHRDGLNFYGHEICGVRFLRRVRRLGAPIRD